MARPRKKQTVSKGKQVKREKRKRDPRKEKTKQVDAAPDDTSRPSAISAFYGKVLDLVERKTHMPSNSLRYLDPLSTGLLQLDRALSGGWHNVFASIAGQEASGKTTVMYHGMANALSQEEIKFVLHLEPEGTLNTEFAGNVFSQFNLNYHELMDDRTRLRYYRRQVIEKVFDLAHAVLKRMPDKVWVPETNSWGYLIPKRDKYWASLMEVMQLEADKKLSTENDFLCPTDYSGVEGALFLDSLAAMVTESDDEAEVRSKVRAAEAAAFSLHLKRVVSRISSKGVVFPAVNQLRKVPGQTHGDPLYEPGGEAIKFYSAQRLRIGARFMKPYGNVIRDKDAPEQMLEPSVHKPGTFDRYKYKYFRNTKNKIGFPGLRGWLRVWVADAFGRVRGFDPVYDVFEYLRDTGQLRVNGRKKGETLYSFSLRDSVGKKRASMYNSIDPFTHHMFKQMILAEVEGDRKMIVSAGEAMGVSPNLLWRGALRESLFAQIRNDKVVLQIRQKEVKADDDDADDVEEM